MKKKRPPRTYQEQDQEPDPQDQSTWQPEPSRETIIDPEDAELDDVFADFPQNEACIELYRINPQGGAPRFLERMMPSIFNFAYVTEKFGGGKYQAKGKYKNGARVKLPFEIEGDPFPVKRILPKEAVTVEASPTGLTQQLETIVERDPNAAFVSLFKAMLVEMKNSETMLLEKMRLWKDLFAPQTKQETPLDTALTMFQKGLEMSSMMEGGNNNPWLFLIRELKEPLTKIIDTVQVAVNRPPQMFMKPAPVSPVNPLMPPPGQPGQPPGQPTPEPQPNSQEDPQSQVNMLLVTQLKAVLPTLINGAAKNTEPMIYVDFLLDQLPQSTYDALREWLLKPDCLDQLAKLEPGIRYQQEWWVALRSGLLDTLNEELGHAVRRVHPGSDTDPTTEPSTDHDEIS